MNAPQLGLAPDRHSCPWPACSRMVLPFFWGCESHWMALPTGLRNAWYTTRQKDVPNSDQPTAHQSAVADIVAWLRANAEGVKVIDVRAMRAAEPLPIARPADIVRPSTATPDLVDDFSAGFTSGGEVCLFWPGAGEYLVLPERHAAVLRRLFAGG